jgi:hypothetical protein
MDRVFDMMVDRTRSRLDVPVLRTLFGAKARAHRDRAGGPPRLEVVIETPQHDLTLFKVHFGRLTLKGYTKGDGPWHLITRQASVTSTTCAEVTAAASQVPGGAGRASNNSVKLRSASSN